LSGENAKKRKMRNLTTPAKQSGGQGFSQIGTEKQKPSSKKQGNNGPTVKQSLIFRADVVKNKDYLTTDFHRS
jgi:hypothetical protein